MLFNNLNSPKLDLVGFLLKFEIFSMNLKHRKCISVIDLSIYLKKKSICTSTFFQHAYIFTLIFHNMISKIITNDWTTEIFLSIYCNPNIKCNTLFDWLTEKIDKIPTKEHGHLRSSTRIQNWHLRIPLNSFLKLRTLRIKTSIFSWFLSHKCKQIQVHQSTYLVTSRTDNNW